MVFSFPRIARGALALALACIAPPALAWGAMGHRLVARLAESELTPAARTEISRLLAGEADPSLPGIASWADDLRDADPALYRLTGRWHFVNIAEDGCRYDSRRDCPGGDCVVEAIRRQTAILADPRKPLGKRRAALKFVVHFVADAHQPLHAGFARDHGGNDTQVNDAGFGTNLHTLWDRRMLAHQHLSDAAYAERLQAMPLVVPLTPDAWPPDATGWVEASCSIVLQPGFYPDKPALRKSYSTRWTPIAEAQLRRAGSHLAQVLNAALVR